MTDMTMSDCTEPNRAKCPRLCHDFCNKAETEKANRHCSDPIGSVAFRDATWEESCDECAHQEDRHYCKLHSIQVKNMDAVRCKSFESQYSQNK